MEREKQQQNRKIKVLDYSKVFYLVCLQLVHVLEHDIMVLRTRAIEIN